MVCVHDVRRCKYVRNIILVVVVVVVIITVIITVNIFILPRIGKNKA